MKTGLVFSGTLFTSLFWFCVRVCEIYVVYFLTFEMITVVIILLMYSTFMLVILCVYSLPNYKPFFKLNSQDHKVFWIDSLASPNFKICQIYLKDCFSSVLLIDDIIIRFGQDEATGCSGFLMCCYGLFCQYQTTHISCRVFHLMCTVEGSCWKPKITVLRR